MRLFLFFNQVLVVCTPPRLESICAIGYIFYSKRARA